MIKTIKVTNYLDQSMTLSMRHPESTGIFIANIEGLGPAKADINIADTSTTDGGVYNSSRLQSRNIVMTLGFLYSNSIEETRLKIYKYFPVKHKLKLTIETDIRTVEIEGYVETNDVELFSKQQVCQISIICPDPNFYSKRLLNTTFSGVESNFSFPFSNESLTEKVLVLGFIRIKQEETVFYKGDSEVGVDIHIHALGPATNVTIYNVTTRKYLTIDDDKLIALTGSGITLGDDILITTTTNSKGVTLYRSGESINILNTLGRDPDWFSLTKGDNIFVYTADFGSTNLQFRITNRIAYEGV